MPTDTTLQTPIRTWKLPSFLARGNLNRTYRSLFKASHRKSSEQVIHTMDKESA